MNTIIGAMFSLLVITLIAATIIFLLCVIVYLIKEMKDMGYDPIKKIKEMLK